MRRDIPVKTAHLIAFLALLVLPAHLAFAQGAAGGSGGDISSAGYEAKTASADPGVSVSQSANYVYSHGTLWFDDAPTDTPPSPVPAPISSGGGGSSGSGWVESLFGGNPQVGGVSPEVDVPFTDTPEAVVVTAEFPTATFSAVKQVDAPAVVREALENPQSEPQIIRLVDENGVTRELNIVLFKRIMPWPLWIALLIILLGVVAIVGFVLMRGAKDYLLWVGGAFILIGVITGIVVRFAYRVAPIDPTAITSIGVVPVEEMNATIKKFMTDLPLGVHVVEAVNTLGKKVLVVKVFITPALPI